MILDGVTQCIVHELYDVKYGPNGNLIIRVFPVYIFNQKD